jgi:hypothetical protein
MIGTTPNCSTVVSVAFHVVVKVNKSKVLEVQSAVVHIFFISMIHHRECRGASKRRFENRYVVACIIIIVADFAPALKCADTFIGQLKHDSKD